MDGIAVLEQVKQTHPETEVIVATAFGEMDLAIRALQLDASDFITKPLHSEALTIALERAQTRYNDRKQLMDYTIFLEREVEDQARILRQSRAIPPPPCSGGSEGYLRPPPGRVGRPRRSDSPRRSIMSGATLPALW